MSHVKTMPVAYPKPGHAPVVKVISTQEKGSDVNLASHLLFDAFKGNFDSAVIVSNDSDLITPVRMVKQEFRKTIGVISPYKTPSRTLIREASFYKVIRENVLQMSQFPVTLRDIHGDFHKPSAW